MAGRHAIVSQLMAVNAGQQFSAVLDIEDPLAQQSPCRTALGRIDVGRRDEIGVQQMRQFLRVDAVVLVLAAMNGFDVQRMGQDKSQAGLLAGIRQPVPAEHAFTAHRQAVLVRLDQLEEVLEVIVFDVGVDQLFTLFVHHADVHLVSVHVDSAVELRRGSVIFCP